VDPEELKKKKGVKMILRRFRGWTEALSRLYPDIGLELEKFPSRSRANKAFFDTFAKENGFDPRIPDNWYKVSGPEIYSRKGYSFIHIDHKGSWSKALMHIYPDIGLDHDKFSSISKRYWAEAGNRKGFFDNFALENNFDPLVPENWHTLPIAQIKSAKRARSVLKYYQGNVRRALLGVYPNIGLNFRRRNAS